MDSTVSPLCVCRSERVARALRAGIVWQNCSQPAFVQAPWGGFKKSGFGRELGKWALDEFMGLKQITSCAPTYSFEWYGSAAAAAAVVPE